MSPSSRRLHLFGHVHSVILAFGINQINEIPPVLMLEIILLNGVLSLFVAYYFRKYGFLAAVGIHFWVDVVWPDRDSWYAIGTISL